MSSKLTTDELRRLDKQHIWHPFTHMSLWNDAEPVVITDAQGMYLIDSDGSRYLDDTPSRYRLPSESMRYIPCASVITTGSASFQSDICVKGCQMCCLSSRRNSSVVSLEDIELQSLGEAAIQ